MFPRVLFPLWFHVIIGLKRHIIRSWRVDVQHYAYYLEVPLTRSRERQMQIQPEDWCLSSIYPMVRNNSTVLSGSWEASCPLPYYSPGPPTEKYRPYIDFSFIYISSVISFWWEEMPRFPGFSASSYLSTCSRV